MQSLFHMLLHDFLMHIHLYSYKLNVGTLCMPCNMNIITAFQRVNRNPINENENPPRPAIHQVREVYIYQDAHNFILCNITIICAIIRY